MTRPGAHLGPLVSGSPVTGRPLVVVCFTGNSGLTDYAVSFCREAARSRPVVLMTAESVDPFYREMGFPVETVFRRSRHYLVDVVGFLRRVLALEPAVVLFQGPLKFAFLDALVVRLLRMRRVPVAVVVHDVVPHSQRRISTWALHFYYRSFPRLVVHSDQVVPQLREAGVQGDTLTVPHGRYDIFDVDSLSRAEARAALGIDPDVTVALFFGNLEERKGIEVFVEAARACTKASQLFIAAGQDFLTAQSSRALRAVLRGSVPVEGLRLDVGRVPHRDVQKYFRAADVVVLPYLEGTTSGVLKLALAFGVPVLATSVGDIGEQIGPESGRLLGPRPSPEAVLRGIAEVALIGAPTSADDDLAWSRIAPQVVSFVVDGS